MFNNLYGVSSCVWEQMDTGRQLRPHKTGVNHIQGPIYLDLVVILVKLRKLMRGREIELLDKA